VKEFIDRTDVRAIMFMGDNMIVTHDMARAAKIAKSQIGKGKAVLFSKLNEDVGLSMDNIKDELVVNELTHDPVEHLDKIASEVYLPILSNPANQVGWGEVVAKEIADLFQNFMASVSITVGQTEGKTVLPLPPLEVVEDEGPNKNRIALLEGTIIIWMKQIKNVLNLDPETALKQGLDPTPDAELQFWRDKAGHLNAIYEQLQSERVRAVLRVLDNAKSTYRTTFAALYKEVFKARREANDNSKYLATMEDYIFSLNGSDDFPALPEIFRPMMHIFLLIWKNSKHYSKSPARLVVLLREMCNSIVNQACKFVNGPQVSARCPITSPQ
jgi:dynein heavy chain